MTEKLNIQKEKTQVGNLANPKRFPVEKVKDLEGLTSTQMEYAEAYGEYIDFTHNDWVQAKSREEHGVLEKKRNEMFMHLNELEEKLEGKTIAVRIMFRIDELFNTPAFQASQDAILQTLTRPTLTNRD